MKNCNLTALCDVYTITRCYYANKMSYMFQKSELLGHEDRPCPYDRGHENFVR